MAELGVAPAAAIDQPTNFATLPQPFDAVTFEALGGFPYEGVRIASRYEVNEDAFDEPMGDDSGYTIIHLPGYQVWRSRVGGDG